MRDNPGYFAWQAKKFHRIDESAYSPIWSEDRPTDKAADGTKRKVTGVVALTPEQADLTLAELALVYPAPDLIKASEQASEGEPEA